MIDFSHIRVGLVSTALLLTTALASPALAANLPEISPRQIASDVEVIQNPQTGAPEFIAPGFDPFEEDRQMAGSASLRSVGEATTIDGQPVRGGAVLDLAFYYNSASNDPYDTRGYTDAVYLSGEYAPVMRRDNRILECNEHIQDVVYYHDDYYRPSLYGGLYRPYPFYTGHFGFSSGYGYNYGFNGGFGLSSGFIGGSFIGTGRIGAVRPGRVTVRNRNRDRDFDRRRDSDRETARRRFRDSDRTSEERREARETRRANRESGRTAEDRRAARETRRDNRETRRANRDNGATGQQTRQSRQSRQSTPRNTRNTAAGEDRLARARRNAFRAERASIVMPIVSNSSKPKTSTSRGTPKASARRSAPKAATTSRPSPRRQSVSQPKPRSTSPTSQRRAASKPAPRSSSQRSAPSRSQRSVNRSSSSSKSSSPSRSSSRSTSRSSSRRSRNVNVNSKRRLISFLPMASAWSRNIVRNVDIHCAREEMLSVYIPQDRLDAARFDGLTVLVLDRAGHELPVFVPPNYIEGFRQAVVGHAAPNVSYQEPITPVQTQPAPVYQDPRTYGYEEVLCPAGTTKQADGTCLQGGTVTYGGYPTR